MKPYEFLDELTWADVAFRAHGKTIEELFANAALATTESMVMLSSVKPILHKDITVTDDTIEKLLYSFLEELILIKDSEQYFLHDCTVAVKRADDNWICTAHSPGDTIKPDEQTLHNDVKAITYHEFKVEQTKNGWTATIILD